MQQGRSALLLRPKAKGPAYTKIQAALAGSGGIYATRPYPLTFLLILAPLAALPYIAAFLVWDLLTLAGLSAQSILLYGGGQRSFLF